MGQETEVADHVDLHHAPPLCAHFSLIIAVIASAMTSNPN
jgi:hypothetical protein